MRASRHADYGNEGGANSRYVHAISGFTLSGLMMSADLPWQPLHGSGTFVGQTVGFGAGVGVGGRGSPNVPSGLRATLE